MPYLSPADVVTGTTITSAWGDSVKAAADFLANPPHVAARHNTTQSITNATWTALVFNTEDEDTAGFHDTGTNTDRFVIPDTGLYVVSAGIEFATNGTGQRVLGLQKNGTPSTGPNVKGRAGQPNPGAGSAAVLSLSTVLKLTAADIVRVLVFQSSGGALNVGASATEMHPYATFTWIGLG
jgi:hypothetical protein